MEPAEFAATQHEPQRSRIGVCWKGNKEHANDANRSLDPRSARRLRRLGMSLLPEHTGAWDFQDTADIIAGLDLVITVDTSVAHLAASLGKPTWILLPFVETDWRWMKGRTDSPWYPSATLYRQPAPGDWASVLDRIEQNLARDPYALAQTDG